MKIKYKKYCSENPIPEKELEQFYREVKTLAEKRFGVDEDGDVPVQIKIIDRTRYEYLHFLPMPYRSWDEKMDAELLDNRLRIASISLSIAQEQNDHVIYDVQEFLKEIKKERKNAK